MKRYNITLWITLLLISVNYLQSADSFQCFECENCPIISEDDKDYIKDCTSLASVSTQEPENTPTSIASTKDGGIVITSSEAVQSSTPSSSSIGLATNSSYTSSSLTSSTSTSSSPTSLIKTDTTHKLQFGSSDVPTTQSSVKSTTEKPKVTNSWFVLPNSIEENELNNLRPELEERSDELFSWRSPKANEVCYVLKFNYEGHEITKRGCGRRGQNKDQICQILGRNEPDSECEVCEGNLCNSGSIMEAGVIGLLIILFIIEAYI